jgi:hypothetical protein
MNLIVKIFLVICFLSGWGNLSAQEIIKVVPKFVLIDTDQDIGKLGDEIGVYRDTKEGRIKVGEIQILKFSNGQTGAKIVWIEPGLSISVGDRVQNEEMLSQSNFPLDEEEDIYVDQTERTSDPPGRLAIGISRFVPAQDLDRILIPSFCISASFRIGQIGPHYFYAGLDYPILNEKSSMSNVSSPSLWSLHVRDHIRVIHRIYYDMGAGLYNSKIPAASSSSQSTSSSSQMGFLLGMSVDLQDLSSIPMIPFVQCHMYQTDSEWQLYAIAGLSFHLSILK